MCMFSPTIDTSKSDDQLKRQNNLVDAQLQRQNSLQDKAINATSGDLSGKQGFDPQLLAALTSQFLNQNSSNFQSATSNVNAGLQARGMGGGNLPGGGDTARNIAELEAAKANSQSQGTLGLGVANLQTALTNKWNAINVLNGQAAQAGANVGTFNAGANSSLNALNQAMIAASNNSFGTAFGQSFGSGLGAGLSGIAAGTNPGKIGGCWIAETIYGKNDVRTHILRFWLNKVWAKKSVMGKMVMVAYLKVGKRVSRIRLLCFALKPLFDLGLRKATNGVLGDA